jgi:hypothetical protein
MRCLHAGVHECMAGFNGLAQLGWAGLGSVGCMLPRAFGQDARCGMQDGDVGHEARRGEARRDAAERV